MKIKKTFVAIAAISFIPVQVNAQQPPQPAQPAQPAVEEPSVEELLRAELALFENDRTVGQTRARARLGEQREKINQFTARWLEGPDGESVIARRDRLTSTVTGRAELEQMAETLKDSVSRQLLAEDATVLAAVTEISENEAELNEEKTKVVKPGYDPRVTREALGVKDAISTFIVDTQVNGKSPEEADPYHIGDIDLDGGDAISRILEVSPQCDITDITSKRDELNTKVLGLEGSQVELLGSLTDARRNLYGDQEDHASWDAEMIRLRDAAAADPNNQDLEQDYLAFLGASASGRAHSDNALEHLNQVKSLLKEVVTVDAAKLPESIELTLPASAAPADKEDAAYTMMAMNLMTESGHSDIGAYIQPNNSLIADGKLTADGAANAEAKLGFAISEVKPGQKVIELMQYIEANYKADHTAFIAMRNFHEQNMALESLIARNRALGEEIDATRILHSNADQVCTDNEGLFAEIRNAIKPDGKVDRATIEGLADRAENLGSRAEEVRKPAVDAQ